jgi:serine-type D-Ala-D-Ala carboxypeptidase/endopeptidase
VKLLSRFSRRTVRNVIGGPATGLAWIAMVATVAFAALATFAPTSVHAQLSDARIKEILSLRASADKRAVGIAAVVVQGKTVRIVTHGTLGLDRTEPVTADTLFEIGSVTKTFTALLLADMVLKGEVKLDDPVERYLPPVDSTTMAKELRGIKVRDRDGAPIRLIDLATHRSGLPRMPDNMPRSDPLNPYVDFGEPQLLTFLKNRAAKVEGLTGSFTRKRDQAFEYSNLGFGLLGYALARAANLPYAELLQKRVLMPLGMTASFIDTPSSESARYSDGHTVDQAGTFKKTKHWQLSVLAPAGALVMSARDMGRYAQAASGGIDTPLAAAFAFAQKRYAEGGEPTHSQGLAWVLTTLNGHTAVSHRGQTGGFSSALWVDPETKAATAVLSNANAGPDDIALHLLEPRIPVKGAAAAGSVAVPVALKTLQSYVGTYNLEPKFDVTIRLRDGKLFAQATDQVEIELFSQSDTAFVAPSSALEMVFENVKDGKATRFQITQGGSTRPAPRVE